MLVIVQTHVIICSVFIVVIVPESLSYIRDRSQYEQSERDNVVHWKNQKGNQR